MWWIENKSFVDVDERNFWDKETLKLTTYWSILNDDLKGIVDNKLYQINDKISNGYKNWLLDFEWEHSISSVEKQQLSKQLKDIITSFNQELARIEEEYIWRIWENKNIITNKISSFFWDKSLFVEKQPQLASRSMRWLERMWEGLGSEKIKELKLN